MQRKLTVASAFDAEGIDDVSRGGAQHLIFAVAERDGGRDDDAVPRVYADGIEILHAANRNHVSVFIAHAFKLDLLPPGDAFFDQNLMDGRHADTVGRDFGELLACLRNAAAAAAERERRAYDHGIADLLGKAQRIV